MRSAQQGDVSVYISLVMVSVMLTAAVLFSLILARQIRATEDAIASERALYAANTGLELGLYQIIRQGQAPDTVVTINGTVQYDSGDRASYEGTTKLSDGVPCVVVTGKFRASQRRLRFGVPGCLPE